MSAVARERRAGVVAGDADECPYVLGDDGLERLHGAQAAAWLGLQRAHRELTRELEAALSARHGLSLSALELLGRLGAEPDPALRLSRLAAEVGLSLSRVSRITDALEARDLVRREPCPEDSRATNVRLTAAGLALVREAQASHLDDVRRTFLDRISADEVRVLGEVFTRLADERAAA